MTHWVVASLIAYSLYRQVGCLCLVGSSSFVGNFMLFTVETASDDSILKLTQLLSEVASHLESSRSSVSPAWPCLPGTCPSAKA